MKTPLEAANVIDLGKRALWAVNVRFQYQPPANNSKKFRPFRDTKAHMEWTASVLPTLDQSELFRILQAIEKGEVYQQWYEPVKYLWDLKRTNKFTEQILLDNGTLQLFLGDDETELLPMKYDTDSKFIFNYEG